MKFLSNRVKIDEVKLGDLVLSCDIETQTDVYRKVLNVMRPIVPHEHQVKITSTSDAKLITSDTHPTAINEFGKIKYVKGGDITTADYVVSVINKKDKVKEVTSPNVSTQYADFSIDEHENYYAGMEPDKLLLAHNSATVFYPIWHHQFDDLIVLKNNQGTEETRVRHMDYGVVLNAFFWRRFKNQENITFFDPNEVPDLYEAFYKNTALFEELYVKYEKRTDLRTKTMSAEEVFKGGILKERTDTGRIYLVFIDNVQNQGPFDPEYHTIYQSNLCCLTGETEIEVLNNNGNIEKMSLQSFVERFKLGGMHGAKVKSYDDGKIAWASVTGAQKTKTVTELYEIEDESGNIIQCTGDHLIFTKNRGYVRADQLVETDVLCVGELVNSHLTVRTIKVEPTDVYDISVPDTSCFFANNILVHNCEILLPTKPFNSLDDEGEFKLTLDNGQEITLPGQHKVLLSNGEKKKVRELTDDDDIKDFLV